MSLIYKVLIAFLVMMILKNIGFLKRLIHGGQKEPRKYFQRYDENVSQSVPAGTTATLFTFRVPSKCKLRLEKFANYLGLVGAWTFVTWRIIRNGVGISPYNAIRDPIGQPFLPEPIQAHDFQGTDVLTINVTNNHGVAVVCGIRIVFVLEGF